MTAPDPKRVALVAFAAHQPGLRLLYGLRQRPRTTRINLVVVVAALVAAWLGYTLVTPLVGLACFVAGHFSWSVIYSGMILHDLDGTVQPRESADGADAPSAT